jgi:hypothetical protein
LKCGNTLWSCLIINIWDSSCRSCFSNLIALLNKGLLFLERKYILWWIKLLCFLGTLSLMLKGEFLLILKTFTFTCIMKLLLRKWKMPWLIIAYRLFCLDCPRRIFILIMLNFIKRRNNILAQIRIKHLIKASRLWSLAYQVWLLHYHLIRSYALVIFSWDLNSLQRGTLSVILLKVLSYAST